MMDLLQRFKDYIIQHDLFHTKDKLLLAVSGGVDSVVLCELCKQAGYDFIIVHCNFQLRGAESESDEKFVKSLAGKYGVELLVKNFEAEKYSGDKKISIQEAARELRYQWFAELTGSLEPGARNQSSRIKSFDAEHKSRNFLLTAHHADDNIETLVMNFFRGTGLSGLTGIPIISHSKNVRRPLLDFWKEELIAFAVANQLDFVEDSSNQSSKYTRNLFRNEIIPLIKKAYPQVKENLRDDINRFKEIKKLYEISVDDLKRKLLKQKSNEVHIPIKQLLGYKNKALIFEIIAEYGFSEKHVDEVIKLTESESGRFIQSPATPARIIKFRNWLIISTAKSLNAETIIIEEGEGHLEFENGKLLIENMPNSKLQIPGSLNTACLDAKEIKFPLLLRKWKAGDYFYPLGMKSLPAGRQGKKKLARFFIDQKLSKTQKENTWVIEMNKKIIWVVGHRIDDRFKITDKTKSILKISFINAQTE